TLGETEPVPLMHIRRIVQTLGPDRASQLLEQARAVEAAGGLMLLDGRRRRTPAGVFFRLVRDQTTTAERNRIWPWTQKPRPNVPAERGDGGQGASGRPISASMRGADLPRRCVS